MPRGVAIGPNLLRLSLSSASGLRIHAFGWCPLHHPHPPIRPPPPRSCRSSAEYDERGVLGKMPRPSPHLQFIMKTYIMKAYIAKGKLFEGLKDNRSIDWEVDVKCQEQSAKILKRSGLGPGCRGREQRHWGVAGWDQVRRRRLARRSHGCPKPGHDALNLETFRPTCGEPVTISEFSK